MTWDRVDYLSGKSSDEKECYSGFKVWTQGIFCDLFMSTELVSQIILVLVTPLKSRQMKYDKHLHFRFLSFTQFTQRSKKHAKFSIKNNSGNWIAEFYVCVCEIISKQCLCENCCVKLGLQKPCTRIKRNSHSNSY